MIDHWRHMLDDWRHNIAVQTRFFGQERSNRVVIILFRIGHEERQLRDN